MQMKVSVSMKAALQSLPIFLHRVAQDVVDTLIGFSFYEGREIL